MKLKLIELTCAASLSLMSLHAASAQQPTAAPYVAHPDATMTPVTTDGGTRGLLPVFTGASTISNSLLYYSNGTLGIGRYPAAPLDVQGKSIFRGGQVLSRSGDATTTTSYPSFPFIMQSSVYNSTNKGELLPYFQLQTEPTGNNTAATGATFNFLYYSGIGANPSETGLYFNPNGTIHFAPAQTFPITTGPQGPAGPTGPQGPAGPSGTAGPNITVSGTITAGSFTASSSSPYVSPISVTASGDDGDTIRATASGPYGVAIAGEGRGPNGAGLEGFGDNAPNNTGSSVGLYAQGTQMAAYFNGPVEIDGSLSKSGGSFKIDHPVDPANKYLYHSFVESPDMMNIYNGNVITDASGVAIVTMPDYFVALNRDFRYQLTVMGQFAQAIVGSEMTDGAFTIKTDKPNVKVSWMVTGIRQDAWANAHRIPNEVSKAEEDKGHYLHPELFGHPEEGSIMQRNHHLPKSAPIASSSLSRDGQ